MKIVTMVTCEESLGGNFAQFSGGQVCAVKVL